MPGRAPLRLLILGAHPDDAEFHAGGLATIYRRREHLVKFVSLTNGAAGHHQRFGPELVAIRFAEAQRAAELIGAECDVWDYPDGELVPTLELRRQVIAEIRRYQPDLILTHRTNDYHPDHRAVGHVVRDACYMIGVPAIVPEVPVVARTPVVAYLPDRFTKPTPLAGDVVVDVSGEIETIVAMLACHESQVFEWLPFNLGIADQVPPDDAGRRRWLRDWFANYLRPAAERYRSELIRAYGPVRGSQVRYAEAFEISEYAAPLDAAMRERHFGFVGPDQ
ncbi:MAG: PIG-L family deacetylase [Planctomycetaceae bacterium]|nr:PIG-L family deacetylase [Planctomycetaceae bacterium]